jgi:hypothetical protein
MLNAGEIEPGLVAHHWLIRGTNTGPGADGSEPTGRGFSFKHSDIHAAHGDWPFKPNLPLIPGHEAIGIVESVGNGIRQSERQICR